MTDEVSQDEDVGEEMLEENTRGEELPEKMQDPRVTEQQEIEQIRQNIESLHDMADRVKLVGKNTSEELSKRAEEAESEELKQEYNFLANTARQAYRRIEHGDNTIVRNGI